MFLPVNRYIAPSFVLPNAMYVLLFIPFFLGWGEGGGALIMCEEGELDRDNNNKNTNNNNNKPYS